MTTQKLIQILEVKTKKNFKVVFMILKADHKPNKFAALKKCKEREK